MGEVKVLGAWSSPFVKRVEMALKMKGVEYEYAEEDLSNKSPLLLESNPIHKKVPVLLHNGKPIAESMIIVEFIDQNWEGPPILPIDPHQRVTARFWSKFIDEKCVSTLWKACWSKGEEEHEKLKEEAIQNLKFLENEIKGKRYFGGDKIGFVDIAANFIAYWIPIFSELAGVQLITEKEFPNFPICADGATSTAITISLRNIYLTRMLWLKDSSPNKFIFISRSHPIIILCSELSAFDVSRALVGK